MEEFQNNAERKNRYGIKISLVVYDLIIFFFLDIFLFVLYRGEGGLHHKGAVTQTCISLIILYICRYIGKIYRQVWRYGGIQCYIRFLLADGIACVLYFIIERLLPIEHISLAKLLAFCCMNTLFCLSIRMVYRYAYKCGNQDNTRGRFLRWLLKVFAFGKVRTEADPDSQKIKVAILGAGSVGVSLAEDLWNNPLSGYVPRCFIDNDFSKIGREIHSVSVMSETEATLERLREHHIQEIIFAVPNMDSSRKVELFNYYQKAGFKIKVFDFPTMNAPGAKRQLRDFSIEDLLSRDAKEILDEHTREYYRDKVILITGGGGSIGSEICRQLAEMKAKQLIILDIYENTAYELEQSLKFHHKDEIDVRVEIVSITNKRGLARVFRKYHPDIVIHAAAHKHVPLMENNSIEAVENNVFGALNVVQLCEEYGTKRFMLVSTDKAVNPTNVMGATKRMCEMIMQAYSTRGSIVCSATRFGNVLGSAGSVIPLFRRQIANGGPVTVTDKRIIRYFMTIPEASQLVLVSGAMAQNGEIFVLDMGKPVKIYDLAENMIRLSGVPCKIVETGLRPGEKLYEELLVKSDKSKKTDNDLIYVEQEDPISISGLEAKLSILKDACESDDDQEIKNAMKKAVPTYHDPKEVNEKADLQKMTS